ncbi:MAG: carbohydrate ABC transporter permease [Clostridia bacterium]|nr:carbohydrate ABC transporter permease [Clostridia bacterium]
MSNIQDTAVRSERTPVAAKAVIQAVRGTKKQRKKEEWENNMVETKSAADIIVDVIVYIIVALVAFCSVIPMWHVLMSSFSDGKSLLSHVGLVVWPVGGFTLAGYEKVFSDSSVISGYINTIIYTVATTVIGFLLSTVTGYALSRDTKLKKPVTMALMVTMLFGGGMVPTYMVIRALGWVGTPWALVIPGCTNSMYCIMMMNAFNSIDKSMYEAAHIDGAGHLSTLFEITLPQAMNMGSVIILNLAIGAWNSWLPASIYVPNKKALWPLQLVVKQITADNAEFLKSSNPDYARYLIQFAVIIIAIAPLIIAFPFFQDKMEKGVIQGGVKG